MSGLFYVLKLKGFDACLPASARCTFVSKNELAPSELGRFAVTLGHENGIRLDNKRGSC